MRARARRLSSLARLLAALNLSAQKATTAERLLARSLGGRTAQSANAHNLEQLNEPASDSPTERAHVRSIRSLARLLAQRQRVHACAQRRNSRSLARLLRAYCYSLARPASQPLTSARTCDERSNEQASRRERRLSLDNAAFVLARRLRARATPTRTRTLARKLLFSRSFSCALCAPPLIYITADDVNKQVDMLPS